MNQTTTLLTHKNSALEIPVNFQNKEGHLDKEQLLDDIDTMLEVQDDLMALKGILAEIEARVKHKPTQRHIINIEGRHGENNKIFVETNMTEKEITNKIQQINQKDWYFGELVSELNKLETVESAFQLEMKEFTVEVE